MNAHEKNPASGSEMIFSGAEHQNRISVQLNENTGHLNQGMVQKRAGTIATGGYLSSGESSIPLSRVPTHKAPPVTARGGRRKHTVRERRRGRHHDTLFIRIRSLSGDQRDQKNPPSDRGTVNTQRYKYRADTL